MGARRRSISSRMPMRRTSSAACRCCASCCLPPDPTRAALALEAATHRELELAFVRGATPDLDALVGWELRGINHPQWAKLAGIKKFIKGFYRHEDGRVMGYNCPVVQNVLDG